MLLSGCTILRPHQWPKGSGNIVLTFDDGPTPGKGTERLLDVLKKREVKATFCLIGQNVTANPDVVKRMEREGHTIANHTFSHRLTLLRARKMNAEIEETDAVIRSATGKAGFQTRLFRPPYGLMTPAVVFSRESSTRRLAYLTMYLGDAEADAARAPKIMEKLKMRLLKENGGAVVFHEMRYVPGNSSEKPGKEWLPAAVDELIVWARANGLRFTTYQGERSKYQDCLPAGIAFRK